MADIFSADYRDALRIAREQHAIEPSASDVNHLLYGRLLVRHGHVSDHMSAMEALPLDTKDRVRHLRDSLHHTAQSIGQVATADAAESVEAWQDVARAANEVAGAAQRKADEAEKARKER